MIASYDIDEGGAFELIETLWNVNEEWGRRMASELRRINRNIVECKYISHIKNTSLAILN